MNIFKKLAVAIVLPAAIVSCSKDDDPALKPVISDVNPTHSSNPSFHDLTISGENLAGGTVVLTDNFGNSFELSNEKATADTLVADIPDDLPIGHYSVEVVVGNNAATEEGGFTLYSGRYSYIEKVEEDKNNVGRLVIWGSFGQASIGGVDLNDYLIDLADASGTIVSSTKPSGSSASNNNVLSLSFVYPGEFAEGPHYLRVNYVDKRFLTPYYFYDITLK